MFSHSNITFSYLVVVSPLLAQLNWGTNIKDSMNKPTSWQVCKQVNINWASDISLSMCAYLLACSHRPHSRLLVSIWPSNKVYHSHWLWASQQATRNYTSVTAYICIILHTQKAPFELFRKSTVKERTWLNWTSDNGWLTPVLQTPALFCLRKVTKLPRNIQNNNKKNIIVLPHPGFGWVQWFWLGTKTFDFQVGGF